VTKEISENNSLAKLGQRFLRALDRDPRKIDRRNAVTGTMESLDRSIILAATRN